MSQNIYIFFTMQYIPNTHISDLEYYYQLTHDAFSFSSSIPSAQEGAYRLPDLHIGAVSSREVGGTIRPQPLIPDSFWVPSSCRAYSGLPHRSRDPASSRRQCLIQSNITTETRPGDQLPGCARTRIRWYCCPSYNSAWVSISHTTMSNLSIHYLYITQGISHLMAIKLDTIIIECPFQFSLFLPSFPIFQGHSLFTIRQRDKTCQSKVTWGCNLVLLLHTLVMTQWLLPRYTRLPPAVIIISMIIFRCHHVMMNIHGSSVLSKQTLNPQKGARINDQSWYWPKSMWTYTTSLASA